jgi:hypothetical protein
VSLTVHVPDELALLLTAEAACRGLSVDEVAAEAPAVSYPRAGSDRGRDALEAFIGSGSSGRRDQFDIHKSRAELAERKLADDP